MARRNSNKTASADTEATDTNELESTLQEALEANQALESESAKLAQEKLELEEKLAAAQSQLKAKDNPVEITQRFESEEHQVGQDGTRQFNADGELEPLHNERLDEAWLKDKAKILAFMEESVEVEIADVTDQHADATFPIWVNGQCEVFQRGTRKWVKRKFVEGLARARTTSYRNELRTNPETGERFYAWPRQTGFRYPFSVVTENNPNGSRWLAETMRQE
ncbi:hypothetical protein HBA55_29700 [Pseudomaricurvus alkylphenolicus]|uniref:hypothetical protein n=1 Tax=Pseudomaricurvus alkylphenolicus TaxID=1306991 RepID=UPI0014229841|nr:hypothetical protein [Pseudomaricurvus alkylphenolicus]NIB43814.1 hypothetical protein [Pseudomaricurvus alkylphenolicus]